MEFFLFCKSETKSIGRLFHFIIDGSLFSLFSVQTLVGDNEEQKLMGVDYG